MSLIDKMRKAAHDAELNAHIVFPEGEDPRIVEGALKAAREGLAQVTLLGNKERLEKLLAKAGGEKAGSIVEGVSIIDPSRSNRLDAYSAAYLERRKGKLAGPEKALEAVREPLVFAAMMVHLGDADGTIGGAVYTTSDTVRTALQIIGKAEDASIVSSFFLMGLNKERHGRDETVLFSDCALIVDPSLEQLADIAIASAASYKSMVRQEPKVAMLSFSTKGSARHMAVTKVDEATKLAKNKKPDLVIDGEMQFDAAFVPEVGKSKAPDSDVAGEANCFIFPNLDAGNTGYKIAQRIGGASATGPILQGLAKPANDLSRGCNSEDVFNMTLVTISQILAGKHA